VHGLSRWLVNALIEATTRERGRKA